MYENELYHFGVKGMKWGIRRFKNKNELKRQSKISNRSSTTNSNKQSIAKKLVNKGKKFVEDIKEGSIEGFNEGWKEAINSRQSSIMAGQQVVMEQQRKWMNYQQTGYFW